MRDSVTVHVKAPPERIWPLVSDIRNTRRFAAETFDAEWLDGDGTDVTESFELRDTLPLRLYWALLGWARRRTNLENMRATLERIKVAAEAE